MSNTQLVEEYFNEKVKLETQGIPPVGINSHLESFKAYLEWRKKQSNLFDNNDKAKDLI